MLDLIVVVHEALTIAYDSIQEAKTYVNFSSTQSTLSTLTGIHPSTVTRFREFTITLPSQAARLESAVSYFFEGASGPYLRRIFESLGYIQLQHDLRGRKDGFTA